MMNKITCISSASGDYEVYFIDKLHEYIQSLDISNVFFLVDDFFIAEKFFPDSTYFISASEENKTLTTVYSIAQKMASNKCGKTTTLVAVGGGIVQDLATFISSVYMRGISWVYIPTTLLSIVDSCIGGKSSINIRGYKNLLGNFYPPTQILCSPGICFSLPLRDIGNGLLEAIKIVYAHDPEYFVSYCDTVLDFLSSGFKDEFKLKSLLEPVFYAKKYFVEEDEFDTGIRKLLNFGHTYGHALETASNFAIPHGLAVGFGILLSMEFTSAKSLLLYNTIVAIISATFPDPMPITINWDTFVTSFKGDKKHTDTHFNVVSIASSPLPAPAPIHYNNLRVQSFEADIFDFQRLHSSLIEVMTNVNNLTSFTISLK